MEVVNYLTALGNSPFEKWLKALKDRKGKGIIQKKIDHLLLGRLSDCRSLGEDLFEIRIPFGPGYRVYFGKDGESRIVLLYGGDKDSQKKDIERVKKYWKIYKGG